MVELMAVQMVGYSVVMMAGTKDILMVVRTADYSDVMRVVR